MPRLLTFTTLYPNAVKPGHGVFVENRLRQLLASGEAEATVVAPVPWFPRMLGGLGGYGEFARVPTREERHGIAIAHPRYPVIPKVGMTLAPYLLYAAAIGPVRRWAAERGGFDLIDAHYFYPDGVAVAMLGRRFGKPVVITARGSDVNLIARYPAPRRLILRAAAEAAAVITVSEALRRALIDLGADGDRIITLRNGVDLDAFAPVDRAGARRALGVDGPVLLAVGNLQEFKGQNLIIRALADLPEATLMLAGTGPYEPELRRLAETCGVAARVRFLGRIDHGRLAEVYGAADISILASAREGWPNVILESMACGTPVIASDVGGVPEIIGGGAGLILETRTPWAIAEGVRRLTAEPRDRDAVRTWAERFSWDATTRGQLELFARALGRRPRQPAEMVGR